MMRLMIGIVFLLGIAGYGQQHSSTHSAFGSAANGDYVGLEKMANLSPEDTEIEWFHENTLLVRNNEAILDKVPIFIKHGKKSYSASDGGFLTYRARFFEKDGQTLVEMRLFQSDYVPLLLGHDPYAEVKTYPVRFTSGGIEINGVRYKRKRLSQRKRENLLHLLSQEPMEKRKKKQNTKD